MKKIIEADTDPMKEVHTCGQHLLPLPHTQIFGQIWAKEGDRERDH